MHARIRFAAIATLAMIGAAEIAAQPLKASPSQPTDPTTPSRSPVLSQPTDPTTPSQPPTPSRPPALSQPSDPNDPIYRQQPVPPPPPPPPPLGALFMEGKPVMFKTPGGACLGAAPRPTGFTVAVMNGSPIQLGRCGDPTTQWLPMKGMLVLASTVKAPPLCLSVLDVKLFPVPPLVMGDCKAVADQVWMVALAPKTKSVLIFNKAKRCLIARQAGPIGMPQQVALGDCNQASAYWALAQ